MTVAWNPSDSASNLTYSGGDLVATRDINNVGNNKGVRATSSRSSGKYYFEVLAGSNVTAGNANLTVAMGLSSASLTGSFISSAFGWSGYRSDGRISGVGTTAATDPGSTYAAGDVIGIAIDIGAGKLWVAKNGTWQAGDPATGSTPSFTGLSGALFPAISMSGKSGGVTEIATGRFVSSDFTQSVPSGFNPWDVNDGTLASTESADTASIAAAENATGTLASTEAADVAQFLFHTAATIAPVEANDTLSISGKEIYGPLASTEGNDTTLISMRATVYAAENGIEASDTAAFAGRVAPYNRISEGITLASVFTGAQVSVLREHVSSLDHSSSLLHAFSAIVEDVAFTELVTLVRTVLITEGITLNASTTYQAHLVAQLVESLLVSDGVQNHLQALALIATSLVLNESQTAALFFHIVEQIQATDSFAEKVVQTVRLLEQLLMQSTATGNLTALISYGDSMRSADAVSTKLTATERIADVLGFDTIVVIDGLPYVGWAVNTETQAASEYDNWPYETLVRFGQRYYGANEKGLYLLGGNDDAGNPIQASVLTGETDFGSPQLKRAEWCHIGYTAGGELVMKVISSQKGVRSERWYRAKTTVAGNDREGRFKLGRGVESKYFQFEWVNVDGADFEFKDAVFDIVELSRRV